MDARTCLLIDRDTATDEFDRVVRQLQAVATDRNQSEARRQWVRASTQC